MLTLNQIWIIVIAILFCGFFIFTGSVDKSLVSIHKLRHYIWLLLSALGITICIIYFVNYYEPSNDKKDRSKHTRNIFLVILVFSIIMGLISFMFLGWEDKMNNKKIARREVMFDALNTFSALRR